MSCCYHTQRLKSPFVKKIVITWSRHLCIPMMTPWVWRRDRRVRCKRALWGNRIERNKFFYIVCFKPHHEWCRQTLCCCLCDVWLYILNSWSTWIYQMPMTRMGLTRRSSYKCFFADTKYFKTWLQSLFKIDPWHRSQQHYFHDSRH